jgi:hypothetical protein
MSDVWAVAWKASFNIVAKEEMPPKSQSHCGDDRWRWSGRLKSQVKLGQVGSMISVELNGPGISRQGRIRWSGDALSWNGGDLIGTLWSRKLNPRRIYRLSLGSTSSKLRRGDASAPMGSDLYLQA